MGGAHAFCGSKSSPLGVHRRDEKNMSKITIYTTPICAYCKVAKTFVKEYNVI